MDRRQFLQAAAGAGGLLALGARAQGPSVAPPAFTYPDDAFSRPREDRLTAFATLGGLAHAWGAVERADHYERNEFHILAGEDAIRWDLLPRDIPHAAVNLSERLRRAPTAIRCRVRNDSPHELTAQLLVPEAPWWPERENRGLTWVVGPAAPLPPGEETPVRFVWAEAFRADQGERDHDEPRFPMNALLLSLGGLVPGEATSVVLSDLVVEYPWAAGARVERLALPAEARPGEAIAIELAARVPGEGALDLEFRREPWVLWRERLTEDEAAALRQRGSVRILRVVPTHLGEETLTVGLVAGGYRVEGAEAEVRVAEPLAGVLPRMEIREYNGRPMPFREEEPFSWWGYSSYDFQPGSVAEFGAHGTDSFCIPLAAGSHLYSCCELPNWLGGDRWDFGQLEERVGFCLAANPAAHLTLRLNLTLPPFWHEAHPEELVEVDLGDRRIVWNEPGSLPTASLASEAWREEQERAVRAVIAYVRGRPWASRLYAVWLTGEVTEEWFAWASNDGRLSDYSAPSQAAFGRWLAERGLEGAEEPEPLPPAGWRNPQRMDVLPDTAEGRRVAAYQQYLNDLHVEILARYARVVKEETEGRTLVGAFLGYVVQLAGEPRQATSGHMGLRRALEVPEIDFLAGVPLLDFRTWPEGYVGHGCATESVHAHGKLYVVENDLFSWLHPLHWHAEYNPADPRGGAIDMHERVLAGDCVRGTMAQKFSLMCSWHHDAGLQEAFARHRAAYRLAQGLDRAPLSQVAFLVDDTSFAWSAADSHFAVHANRWMLRGVASAGASVGVWLLSDLDRLPEETRYVVLGFAVAPRQEDAERLRAALEAGGRTWVLTGTPCLVDPATGAWQPERVLSLLGLPLSFRPEGAEGGAVLRATGEWISGNDGFYAPRLDAGDESLLRYPDGPGASAERALPGGGRLIWSGAPIERSGLHRGWMAAAGVHCFAPDGCVVHAARGVASVSSPREGPVALRWPTAVRLTDLLDGWSGEGTEIACPFRAGQTRIFRVEER